MSNAIGESISRLYENSGANVKRMCYQGDVGLHVAKAIYGMHEVGMPKDMSASASVLSQYIGDAYVKGSNEYENNLEARKWIDDVNKKVYEGSDKEVNQVYDWGRKVTLEAFEEIYKILGTKFDYYFFESEVIKNGVEIVEKRKDIFEKSEGAVVFHAEKYDPKLHTRVFISSQGLPTYETKELGLAEKKFKKINPDLSITVTANEQSEYFKVVLKAIEIIFPKIRPKIEHISHGMMRFADGKMSSRTGNIISGESLIFDIEKMVENKIKDRDFNDSVKKKISEEVAVAAIKYSVLRQAISGDIIFDSEKSISFEGDSGPYLQYAAVRANSVLEKAKKEGLKISSKNPEENLSVLERKMARFPDVAARASLERAPHQIATYLLDLAAEFNSYYATKKIIDSENSYTPYRLSLTNAFEIIMKNGLHLLGIEVPEKM